MLKIYLDCEDKKMFISDYDFNEDDIIDSKYLKEINIPELVDIINSKIVFSFITLKKYKIKKKSLF